MAGRSIFRIEPKAYSIFYDVLVFVGYLVAIRTAALLVRTPDSQRLWTRLSAVLCFGLLSVIALEYGDVRARSFRIASNRGDMHADRETGKAFTEALAFLNQARARSERFVVWPEEAMFYYFTGATAPSRWWYLVPGVLPTGKPTESMLRELDAANVKYVALSDRSTPEYGMATFGIDYNQQVYEWLTRNFRVVRTFGNFERVNPRYWGVQIWERNPGQSATQALTGAVRPRP
jgi:hypothetical protein